MNNSFSRWGGGGALTTSGITGVGGRAECPPEISDQEISGDLLGKERQGKKEK